MGFVTEFADLAKVPFIWLSSAANRQRLRGARVEVVIALVARRPRPSVLFVQSYYNDCWMLPQEGVELGEGLKAALARGLAEECGIQMRTGDRYDKGFYVRAITYMSSLELPPERVGERQIAANVEDTPFHRITLRRKAYWLGVVLIESRETVRPEPALNEIKDVRWLSFAEAETAIGTNRPEKAELLRGALAEGARHLDRKELAGGRRTVTP